MKKTLLLVISVLLLIGSALIANAAEYEAKSYELSSYGQKTHAANYISSIPDIDGTVEEGEYGIAIHVLNGYDANDKSQYWNGMQENEENDRFKIADTCPEKATLYMAYDENNLYIAAVVVDDNHYTPGEGTDVWDGDYFEFDVGFCFDGTANDILDRIRIAFGISNSNTPYAYVATASSYCDYKALEEIPGFMVTRNESAKTTVYEAELPWKSLTGSNQVPEKGFFMYQFGVADAELANLAVGNGTKACLGFWRYAASIPAGVIAEKNMIGMHIFTVDKSVFPIETEPVVTEPPATESTETEPVTTEPAVTEPVTTEPAATELTTTAPVTTEPAGNEGGVNPIAIILIVAGVAIVAIVLVAMLKIKKAK